MPMSPYAFQSFTVSERIEGDIRRIRTESSNPAWVGVRCMQGGKALVTCPGWGACRVRAAVTSVVGSRLSCITTGRGACTHCASSTHRTAYTFLPNAASMIHVRLSPMSVRTMEATAMRSINRFARALVDIRATGQCTGTRWRPMYAVFVEVALRHNLAFAVR